jgi:hypothetical protein
MMTGGKAWQAKQTQDENRPTFTPEHTRVDSEDRKIAIQAPQGRVAAHYE